MTAVSCGPVRFRPWRDSRAVSCARRLRERAPRTGFEPMKWRTLIIAGLGLALALYLVWYVGLGAILAAAVAVGWGGFALLCLGSVALFGLLGSAWHVLLPASSGAGAWIFVRARLVRDSASEVLPFSQLGGIAIGARALVLQGVSAPLASASLIVDVTTERLVAAGRSVGVLVPNALGVQEAAYTVLTPLFGAGAELGLAVSLLKRARDIVLGVPVLLVWQAIEGRRALAGAAGADAPGEP